MIVIRETRGGKLRRFGILENVEIQNSPSLGDDAFRMLASGARRVKLYWQKLGANIYEVKQARNGLQSNIGTILKRIWRGLIKDKEAQAVVVFVMGKNRDSSWWGTSTFRDCQNLEMSITPFLTIRPQSVPASLEGVSFNSSG